MKKVNGFTVYEGTDKCALDEYSEQLAEELGEKFEENKYDDTEVKQDIQDLQSEQETQNKAIENNTEELELLKNNLPDPITTDQSEEITVQNAMNYYGSLDVSGNSTQATRSGKNKLYLVDVAETTSAGGITYSVKDGVISLNGTSTRSHYINFKSDAIDLPANNYTMSTKVLSGSYSGIAGKQLNETAKEEGVGDTNIFNGGYMQDTYTHEIEEDKTGVYLSLYIGGTAVLNNYKFEIQLEEGTEATEIEKYGAMPSPDYPSKIKNCKTSINIKVENANKYVPFEASWGAFRGIELAFYLDGTVKLNGTAAASGGRDVTKNVSTKNLLKAGQPYTMYVEVVSGTGETGNIYLNRVDNNAGLRYCKEGEVKTFTQNEDVEVYWGINVIQGNAYDNLMLRFGLFEGTYTYEEIRKKFVIHEEQIIPFPLKEGQLLHEGDYLASDGVHHVKQTCVFDGTENVLSAYLDETIDSFRIAINSKYNQMLSYQTDDKCSHFKNLGHTPAWGRQANTFALSSEGYLYIFFEKNKITSETEAKNWIAEQYNNGTPLTAEGTLEEEYVESYTEEQQAVYNELKNLILYKGYNYITCTDETKCKMQLTYRPDNNIKIKSLEERVAALENSEVTA